MKSDPLFDLGAQLARQQVPLAFPIARIACAEDVTERGVQAIAGIAHDFEQELLAATSPSRAQQLADRLTAAACMLMDVEALAHRRVAALKESTQ